MNSPICENNDSDRRLELMSEDFQARFGTKPTLGVRAPGRVDLMGSHTDYNEGFVLTLSIDRDTWILASPRDDGIVNVASMNVDVTYEFSANDFSEKVEGWGQYVQAVTAMLSKAGRKNSGFNGLVHGTVPIGSGLSSSASLESATATLFEHLDSFQMDKLEKAKLCQQSENEWVGVNCGILDQYSSILGERGEALLLDCRQLTHQFAAVPSNIRPVICNTRAPRQLSGSEYDLRRSQCETAARFFADMEPSIKSLRDVSIERFLKHEDALAEDVRKRARFIIEENARVHELAEALKNDDRDSIKVITSASFVGARDLFEISVPAMQHMYDAMFNASGCIGCRQAGAGFGGCMVALVAEEKLNGFCDEVADAYPKLSGIDAEVYPVQTAPGAGELKL